MIDLYGIHEIKEEERKKKYFGFLFLKIFYEKAASKPNKSIRSFEVRLESILGIFEKIDEPAPGQTPFHRFLE